MAGQCAEKVAKALVILSRLPEGVDDVTKAVEGLSSLEEELKRRIGHTTARLLKMAYEGYRHTVADLNRIIIKRSSLSVEEFKSRYPMLSSLTDSGRHDEKPAGWNSIEERALSITMSEERLEEYLKEIELVYSSVNEIVGRRSEELKESLYTVKDSLVSLLKELQNLVEMIHSRGIREIDFAEAFIRLVEDYWHTIWLAMVSTSRMVLAYLTITMLFILPSPHVSRSRYPKKEFDLLKFYTKEFPQ